MKSYKQWTKEELKGFLTLWENSTVTELATKFGVSNTTIITIAAKFRKEGYPLTKKRQNGNLNGLIREVIEQAK